MSPQGRWQKDIRVVVSGVCMKVCYDKLWKLLIDKKLKRTDLIKNANISSNVLARMGHEEPVSLDSIGKICEYLGCKVDDIIEINYEE